MSPQSPWLLTLAVAIPINVFIGVSSNAAEAVRFAEDVVPILERYCVGCHSEGGAEGGLRLDSHEGLLEGGDSGSALTRGVPGSSRLFLMASGKLEPVMPPDGEEGPTDEELSVLAAWIEQGAEGPDGEMPIKRELQVPKIATSPAVQKPITAIAISADGSRRAIGGFGRIEIQDAHGATIAETTSVAGKVNGLQFSRDGSKLLAASGLTGAYGQAAIFDARSGERLHEFVGHDDTLYAAVFSPDERRVATSSYDHQIILWDVDSAAPQRVLSGHNGAVFDLAFSPDGNVLVSGCADETVKVWHVATGKRLDTLSQPEGEVYAVEVTPDGKFVIAAGADNRLRVWRLRSVSRSEINPIVATRFVDETPLTDLAVVPGGKAVVVLSEAGNMKVLRASDWSQAEVLTPLEDTASDIDIGGNGETCWIALMNGKLVSRTLPIINGAGDPEDEAGGIEPVYLMIDRSDSFQEDQLRQQHPRANQGLPISRGAVVHGQIEKPGATDRYRWRARRGEVWAIDADAAEGGSLDPMIAVLDASGEPVLRTRLQAVRESYFTFRGKNSDQSNDFRMFGWEEMNLDDYLYAAGEVTRLWMHPRGPDSGFNVYPGTGTRWTYFGTNPATHALGEPAYVVRPLSPGQSPVANGLPLFDVYFENDDDPQRRAGKNSRLLFTAPADGWYSVSVSDTRGAGGKDFGYRLSVRAAEPDFVPKVDPVRKPIPRGAGREFVVRADRVDGFEGPITFELDGLPAGLISNSPLTIEEGQESAVGLIWAEPSANAWQGEIEPQVTATATILGRRVERRAGSLGKLKLGETPKVVPSIQPLDGSAADGESWSLQVPRGETVRARLMLTRQEGFDREISFGKEFSGRNATHGVYVDNIGLNGLLVRQGEREREFFITADPVATPGARSFFVTAALDGGITSQPITVEVLP